MSLRILHALRTVDPGAGKAVPGICELLAAQRKFGHTIEVVLLDSSGSAVLDQLRVPVHRLGRSWGAYGYNPRFVRWMKEHAGGFDCVVVHGVWGFNAFGTWLALHEAGTPYFVFTQGALDPWSSIRHSLNHLMRWLYWPWAGYPVLRDAHAVFFLCDAERRRAREAFWLYDCHEFVVRYGIVGAPRDSAGALREEFLSGRPELRGKRIFTFFADANSKDGAGLLIRAVGALKAKGLWKPETMRLLVADPSEFFTEQAVRQLAGRHGLTQSVHWIGAHSSRARWAALSASEVLLRPSTHETWGVNVAEALSSGTPALMSTGVAIWREVVNAGAGFADDEDVGGFTRLLSRWIALGDEERAALKVRARNCFEARYTLQGAANSLTSGIYLLIGVHRDGRWDLRPLRPASELL